MKKLLMIVSLFLALLMLPFGLFGCVAEEPQATESEAPTETPTESQSEPDANKEMKLRKISLKNNVDSIKRLGRTHITQNGIACDHTASGIEFNAVMTGDLSVRIASKVVKPNSPKSYFTVYIDGERQDERYEMEGEGNLKIASFDDEEEHNVRIVKQDENNYTLAEFKDITFTGYLTERPKDKDLYIEVIGDSITCGMGNIGVYDKNADQQKAELEDGSQSYGYMLAEALDADYSIVSESGIGLSASWDDPMVPFYTAASYNRSKTIKHDFKRVPDLVIINLGTNDYFIYGNKDHPTPNVPTPEALKTKAKEFIALVREKYGKDVPILWTIGLIGVGSDHVNAVNQAVTELGGEAKGLYFKSTPAGVLGGGQNHPVVSDNVTLKDTLLGVIRDKGILG